MLIAYMSAESTECALEESDKDADADIFNRVSRRTCWGKLLLLFFGGRAGF